MSVCCVTAKTEGNQPAPAPAVDDNQHDSMSRDNMSRDMLLHDHVMQALQHLVQSLGVT